MEAKSTFSKRPVHAFLPLASIIAHKLFAIVIAMISFSSTNLFSQAPPLSVAVAGSNVSCYGGSNGAALAIVSGGTPDYSYVWSNGGTTSSISGLTPGQYCVTVTDADGNVAASCYTITQPSAALTVSCSNTEISCNGGADGTAAIFNLQGGTASVAHINAPYQASLTSAKATFGPSTYDVTALADQPGCPVPGCQW